MKYFVLIIGLSSTCFQLCGMTFFDKLIKARQSEFSCDLYSPIELFSIATHNSESPEDEVIQQLEALTLEDKTSYLSFLESLDQLDSRMVRLNKKQVLAHLKLGAPIKKIRHRNSWRSRTSSYRFEIDHGKISWLHFSATFL